MKKFMWLLMLLPSLSFAGDPYELVPNAFTFSSLVTSSNDAAWQVFNSSTNSKTVYITEATVSTDKGGFFTFYSTDVGTGFTGALTGVDSTPAIVGETVGISSTTTSSNASSPTGDVVWQGAVTASDTVKIINHYNPFSLRPGYAIYAIKTNGGTNEKAVVNFRLREQYR